MAIHNLDPFPLEDAPLEKLAHMLEESQRVRVKETGHRGKLEVINAHQGHVVMLDSGHRVECRDYELEPEDFPSHHETASAKSSGFCKGYDPIPLDGPSAEPSTKASDTTLQLLAPFLKASRDGLKAALDDGTVSVADRVLIKKCLDNVQNNQIVTDPLGLDYEDENFRTLRIMAEKYAGASGGTGAAVLHKAAGRDRVDDLIEKAVQGLQAGKSIILPPECRIPMLRVPSLANLISTGRICFDYAG